MSKQEKQGCGQITNAEVYGALALILIELQKINGCLGKLMVEEPVQVQESL